MRIKFSIKVDEDSYEFITAKENIDPENEMSLKDLKNEIKDELMNKINDLELSEIFPDWSDLFLN